jgi:Fe-S cluster biogenesis protein NfuA
MNSVLVTDDDLSAKLRPLLEGPISDALAVDGGWISYLGHDDGVVHLRMGGGCQGCAIATTTTMAGLRRILMERIPEIVDVVDVTDHDAGTNPFYTEAPPWNA